MSLAHSGEYSTLEVAELFGVGRSTVYRAIEANGSPRRPTSRSRQQGAVCSRRRPSLIRHPTEAPAPPALRLAVTSGNGSVTGTSDRRVEIVTDRKHEVMAFVAACNRNFYHPTRTHVELWQDNKEPAQAVYKTVRRKMSEGTQPADLLGLQTASNRMVASLVGDSFRPLQEMHPSPISDSAQAQGMRRNASW